MEAKGSRAHDDLVKLNLTNSLPPPTTMETMHLLRTTLIHLQTNPLFTHRLSPKPPMNIEEETKTLGINYSTHTLNEAESCMAVTLF
jgi:hypothetical protein